MACKDYTEDYCKDKKHFCHLGDTLQLCPVTCEVDGCVCRDNPVHEECKYATPKLCEELTSLPIICPKSCGKCPGA